MLENLSILFEYNISELMITDNQVSLACLVTQNVSYFLLVTEDAVKTQVKARFQILNFLSL